MAPQEVVGRYHEYKSKTKSVLYWLTQTVVAISTSKNNAATSTSQAPRSERHSIGTAEIVRLANAIHDSVTPVDVPKGILALLDDVIQGRQACADWYSGQALEKGGKAAKGDESHRYFIETLCKVRCILREARARYHPGKQKADGESDKRTHGHDDMKVGDSSSSQQIGLSALLDAVSISSSKKDATEKEASDPTVMKAPDDVILDLEVAEDDSAFKVWCFLQDLENVRGYVRDIWNQFRKGEVSLLLAGTITTTAFGLLRRIDEDFIAASRFASSDWSKLVKYLGISYFERGETIWMHPKWDSKGKPKQPRMPDVRVEVAALLCPIAFHCLRSWKSEIDLFCDVVKRLKAGKAPRSPPRKDAVHSLATVLYEVVPEIHAIACDRSACKRPELDEFVHGLVDIHLSCSIPIWMVSACQIYLDTYDLVGPVPQFGVHQIRQKLQSVFQSGSDMKAYTEHSSTRLIDMKEAWLEGRQVLKHANHCEAVIRLPKEIDFSAAIVVGNTQPSLRECVFPGAAADVLLHFAVAAYRVGRIMMSHRQCVLSVAHLYRALRGMGSLEATWPDMEFVLTQFGQRGSLAWKEGSQFVGADGVANYLKALGVGSRIVTSTIRRNSGTERKVEPTEASRCVTVCSPLLKAFDEGQSKYYEGEVRERTDLLETVLQSLVTGKSSSATTSAKHLQPHRSTATELLATLKKRFIRDEPTLNFDFVGFTISCADFLEQLASMPGQMQQLRRAGSDDRHTTLIQNLMWCPANWEASQKAAELMQAHIESNGKTFKNRALVQCSGQIPKGNRPELPDFAEAFYIHRLIVKTFLDYTSARYTFSGTAMAVYHSKVVPEVKDGIHDRKSKAVGGATDPLLVDWDLLMPVFGSGIPKAICDEGVEGIARDPSLWNEARITSLDMYVDGFLNGTVKGVDKVSEDMLQETASLIAGLLIKDIKTVDVEDGRAVLNGEVRREAIFVVPAGHEAYKHCQRSHLERLSPDQALLWQTLGDVRWAPWPFEVWKSEQRGVPLTAELVACWRRCAYAVLQAWRREIVASMEKQLEED